MQRAVRSIHVSTDAPRLTRFLLHPPKSVIGMIYSHGLDHGHGHWVAEGPYSMRNTPVGYYLPLRLEKGYTAYVEVEFADGRAFNFSAEFLRVYSPAADSKIRSIGGEKVIFGRRHVGIMSAEPVGNYGVRLLFDDLHKTGIYTWNYFYYLGCHKFSHMRNYIKTLKKHSLSRDPKRT
ncbi:hypothetical protein BVRB_3g068950 isoform B [Beta vulgaris subsp. vulgaris]|nr:hypothetical protein BVRB_3g068950 isoform B [Beta vulgaris subsp. vulgaris]